MFEDVAVAPDYDDPYQYYYFPNRPAPGGGRRAPAVRLLVYKANLDDLKPEKNPIAGFFYFDTTLEWPDATIKKVAKKIQDMQNLEPVRLI